MKYLNIFIFFPNNYPDLLKYDLFYLIVFLKFVFLIALIQVVSYS